ncbi:MAG: HsdM family class I SAM-dependent methyltransferase [Candidatus Helarchaeota archaeon]
MSYTLMRKEIAWLKLNGERMLNQDDEVFETLYKKFLLDFIELIEFLKLNTKMNENPFNVAQEILIKMIYSQKINEDIDFKVHTKKPKEFQNILDKINSFFMLLNEDTQSLFIGNLFENLLRSKDEKILLSSKRLTERKIKGVFYTPKRITRYIVERVLKELILERLKIKFKVIDSFDSIIEAFSVDKLKEMDGIINNLKILDPACGSGAFLLECAEFIFELKKRVRKKILTTFNSFELKKEIIENNLHGVDIYPNALEIIKLRYLIWVDQEKKNNKALLKSLQFDKNLRLGNSLYGFNWQNEFKDVFIKGFAGFDIIVSNPPYGRTVLTDKKEFLIEFYVVSSNEIKKPSYNASSLFIERSINLLNPKGHLGMIIPSSVARTEEFEGIRNFMLNNCNLYEIVDEGRAFKDVTLEMISIFLSRLKKNQKMIKIISRRDGTIRSVDKEVFTIYKRFILYHDPLFDIIMKDSMINLIHARSGIDHRLIKFNQKKDQSDNKSQDYSIPFLHSGKSVQRYYFKYSKFHYIRKQNLTIDRFRREHEEENIVSTAISPFIRASIKPKGIIPGTNLQIIDIDEIQLKKADMFYFLALLNSKFLRIFSHVYLQNKIRYTFKIQDYHVKLYPIKISNDWWVFSFLARILTIHPITKDNLGITDIVDDLLDCLVIELYLKDNIESNLIENVKIFLINNHFDKLENFNDKLLEELILRIKTDQVIKDEIQKIKRRLILNEKELVIKVLDIGCSYDD